MNQAHCFVSKFMVYWRRQTEPQIMIKPVGMSQLQNREYEGGIQRRYTKMLHQAREEVAEKREQHEFSCGPMGYAGGSIQEPIG